MKKNTTTLIATSYALLLSACFGGSFSSVYWTAGTWTESEFAAVSDDDQCGIVSVLNGLDSPLQYNLGPKSADSGFAVTDYELTDERLAAIQDNLWNGGCEEPNGWPRFWCNYPLHEFNKSTWKPILQEAFCPDSTGMSLKHGDTDGLVINENEIFLTHRISLKCGTNGELLCNSNYVSRLRPAGGGE